MKIRRTVRGYGSNVRRTGCSDYWPEGWVGGEEIHVTDKPTHSEVLGPDGFHLEYTDQPFGFDLRQRKG